MTRRSGGFRGAKPTWTTTSTSGIFGMEDVVDLKAAGQWPRGPVAPTSLAGTAGDGQVELTWTAPATTHGTITDYVVEYTPAAGSPTVVATGSTAASYTLAGLTNDTEYTFRVAAVNHTRGDWSDSVAVTPGAAVAAGTMWSWGDQNSTGKLGTGSASSQLSPAQIGVSDWSGVSAGDGHNLAINADGTLWVWGNNTDGKLGDGTITNRTTPVQIGADTTWAAVAAGSYTSYGRKSDGWYAWGSNSVGQLGVGDTTARNSPVAFAGSWVKISAGAAHGLAINDSGELWAWGRNFDGRVGDGTTTQRNSPVKIGSDTWIAIAAGNDGSLGIKADGTLWAWGLNTTYQLGTNTSPASQYNSPVQVGTGSTWATVAMSKYSAHALATRTDGTLWAWGANSDGQLGVGSTSDKSSPQQVGSATNWVSAYAGFRFSLGLRDDGTLWAWGNNASGRLGLGDTTQRTSPVQVGSANWLVVTAGNDHCVGVQSP